MRILNIIPGKETTPSKRDNIFIRRQIRSIQRLIPGMKILYAGLGSNPKDMISFYQTLRDMVKSFQPEVIHSQYATAIGAITILANSGIPTIVSFGGDEVYGTYVNEYSTGSIHTTLARKLSIFCSRRATTCIVKNIGMQQILTDWGGKNVVDIPNGVDLIRFRTMDQHDCREKLGLKQDTCYIVFAIRDHDYVKRLDLAQKSIRLCNLISDDRFELLTLKNVDPDQVPLYLNAGNALLLCSNHEGSPNIVKEALACNRPVVSTDVGDVRQRFSEVYGLFIVPQEPESIAERLLQATQLNRSNGREFVMSLTEDAIARKIVRLYQEVLTKHARC